MYGAVLKTFFLKVSDHPVNVCRCGVKTKRTCVCHHTGIQTFSYPFIYLILITTVHNEVIHHFRSGTFFYITYSVVKHFYLWLLVMIDEYFDTFKADQFFLHPL